MNWVGGSRKRLVMRNDTKKQREFFEKRKMQQKLKNLGVSVPGTSSGGTASIGTDLMTLFIVNQIAAKKANQDPPKVAVLGSSKAASKYRRDEPLVLPMSPCSPSQLNLAESQPQFSAQGIRKRKNIVPLKFNSQQLSPVLESAFSDHSASDYLPPRNDPLSPASSSPLGPGIFPQKMNLQRLSQPPPRPPWDTSVQAEFRPFSQPRGMTDSSWTCRPSEPPFLLETPTAAQVLFGSPDPDQTDERHHGAASFFLQQPEDAVEPKPLFEEDPPIGFGAGDSEREVSASHFGNVKPKIYLPDETLVGSSSLQPTSDSQPAGMEPSSHLDMNSSCVGLPSRPPKGWEYSPSCSSTAGYLSSDSTDDKEDCESCLQACSSHVDETCWADRSHTVSHKSPKPLTPQIESKSGFGGEDSECNGSCKCMKLRAETRDAGTQTASSFFEMSDASTQSCERKTQEVLEQPPATRGQHSSETGDKGGEKGSRPVRRAKVVLQRLRSPFLSLRGNEDGNEDGDGSLKPGGREGLPSEKEISHILRQKQEE